MALYTKAGAKKLLKAAPPGSRFGVFISCDAPIEGRPGRVFPIGLNGGLILTRPGALKLADKLLTESLEARGARLPIEVRTFTPDYGNRQGATITTYWLLSGA